MNINKTNYGAWFIDYFDGNLTAERTAELFLFLEQHTDLKQEFESFNSVTLEPSDIIFEDKNKLKKSGINSSTIEEYLIADLENELNLQDKIKLREFIAENPSYKKEQDLFRLTKLQQESEAFPDKNSLKKKIVTPILFQLRIATAVAAVIIIMLGILYINRQQDIEQSAESVPVKNSVINDSLKDFFNDADEMNSDVQKNKVAAIEPPVPGRKSVESNTSQTAAILQKSKVYPANEMRSIAEPLQLAERKGLPAFNITYESAPETAPQLFAGRTIIDNDKENLKGKIDELKDLAAEKVNQITGEELLYASEITSDPSAEKMPFKSRVYKFSAWALSKISNNKVKLENTFDQSGNIAAYQVSAGKFKYEKDF